MHLCKNSAQKDIYSNIMAVSNIPLGTSQNQHASTYYNIKTDEVINNQYYIPPVSGSLTNISMLSSLHGILGSSPISVRVASNSCGTWNLALPSATRRKENIIKN